MQPVRAIQASFTSGELDASLFGRVDVSRYYSGAALLDNFIVLPQGGIRRRPGTAHVFTMPSGLGLNGMRLIPFAFNTEQTYCVVLTAGNLHIFRPDGSLAHTQGGCPWSATTCAFIAWTQSADSLLLFATDLQPQLIRRGINDTIWTRTAITFTNVPTFDFGSGPEPVFGGARGWPGCATFHQGRLYVGGFAARPSSLIGSVVGDFFNLNTGTSLDDQAIYVTIDSDQVNAIRQLRSSRTLQVFTSGGEFAPDVQPPYTPRNFSLIEQTRRGIILGATTVEIDGATIFVQAGGRALRSFLYSDTEQAFRSDNISLLAPHLVRSPREVAVRRGQAADDADHVFFINPDGSGFILTTLASQQVNAFSRITTEGDQGQATLRSVAALASGQVFIAARRNGAIQIEIWGESRLLDCGRRQIVPEGATTMTGLSHLNGRTVAVVGDGNYYGTRVVVGGSIDFGRSIVNAEVGLPFTPRARTLDVQPEQGAPALGVKMRLHEITAQLLESGTFNLNGRPVVLRTLGGPPAPPLNGPAPVFTGKLAVRGIPGWTFSPRVEIEQPTPGPLTLLSLGYQLRVSP